MSDMLERLKGAVVARYAVERELGAGGMAVVYLAEDRKHHRPVALKVLRPELAQALGPERFLREIEFAARLTHPHILPLYDSGEADGFLYYVMPFIEGASLRDRLDKEKQLPVDEALRITGEVADALDYAHAEGVIHRDIKPENVLLSGGHALVVDFGIGKALSAAGADQLTQTGLAVGTPAYMSPEQAAGDGELDGRSDLYALGCVLYEMLAGEQPFTGATAQAVIAKRFTESVPAVSSRRDTLPGTLDPVVSKVLSKIPADRFTTGAQFAAALELASTMPVPQNVTPVPPQEGTAEKSIAVLPFANMSADPENEYFSDGITEEIINALAQLEDLHVAARTSSFSFKGKSPSIAEVGEELKVTTVLEGSVRKAGNRLRITAQLINVADGYHLWSERYDREMDDVFAIQDEIATTIADKLQVTLAGGSDRQLVRPSTENLDAYQLYLKGRFFLYQRIGASLQNGLECFEQALALDPDYALAHAGRADAYGLLGFYGVLRPHATMPKAKEAALKAIALDDTLSEGHCALALVSGLYDWDWDTQARELRRALELNPSNVQARTWHAFFKLALVEGRFDEAIVEARRAVELDPRSSYTNSMLGFVLAIASRYEEAVTHLQTAIELEPNSYLACRGLGLASRWGSRYPEAIAAFEKSLSLSGRHQWALGDTHAVYVLAGRMEEADAMFDEMVARLKDGYVQSSFFAMGLALRGRKDEAFEWLERAYEERDPLMGILKYWPDFDPLRDDPRFDDMLARIGLA